MGFTSIEEFLLVQKMVGELSTIVYYRGFFPPTAVSSKLFLSQLHGLWLQFSSPSHCRREVKRETEKQREQWFGESVGAWNLEVPKGHCASLHLCESGRAPAKWKQYSHTPPHIHVHIHSSPWSSVLLKQGGERLSSATGCCCSHPSVCVHRPVGNTASASALEL